MTGILSCLVLTSKAQLWSPTPTFDLPVYGIYHNNIPDGHAEPVSNNVYWENLAKAFQQNPREIMHGIETSKERLNSGTHMFRDQYGRQFLWDPRFGAIPVVEENHTDRRIQAIPIVYYNTVTGYIADNQRLNLLIPHEGYLIKQRHPENTECDPNITPMLSFNDGETVDPCTGKSKNKAEFGLTATSGMADVLCMFCQHIKNLQCIWQFCSHPEGVYKIKVSDSKG